MEYIRKNYTLKFINKLILSFYLKVLFLTEFTIFTII